MGKGMSTLKVKTILAVDKLLRKAQKEMSKQDFRISADFISALVNSTTNITKEQFAAALKEFTVGQHNDFTKWKKTRGALDARTIVDEELKNIIGMKALFGKHKTHLSYVKLLHKIILSTGVPTKKEHKPKAPEKFKNDPLALIEENRKHWPEFVSLCEKFKDTFPVAEVPAPFDIPVLPKMLAKGKKLDLSRKKEGGYKDGKVKGLPRVVQKFFYKYQLDARKVVDVIRASFVFDDILSLYQGLYLAIEFFKGHDDDGDVKNSMWMKDRFNEPLANEYRDVILQVKVPGTGIWAEIQFHLREALNYKDECMHAAYGTMRHFPNAEEITKVVRALLPESKKFHQMSRLSSFFTLGKK